jgi:SsrA-binding protein
MSKPIATNKKAYRDYFLSDQMECGIELKGSEVKSIRAGNVNFKDSFARVGKGEIYLYNFHIEPYAQASYMNEEADRPRRLLLHKKEILKLDEAYNVKRQVIVPTKVYFNDKGKCKIELALGRGKKLYDKRETIKKRDIDRAIGRTMRSRNIRGR